MRKLPQRPLRLGGGFLILLFLGGCGRVSDPLPPLILIPKRTEALALRQIGNRIELTFPVPRENTDGSPVQALREVRLYRLAEERSSNAAEPDAKKMRRDGEVAGSVKGNELQGRTSAGTIHLLDEPPDLLRQRLHYAVEFVNKKEQSDGISNIVTVSPVPVPPPPAAVRTAVSPAGIKVEWDPPSANLDGSTPPRIAGYNVYRSYATPPDFSTPLNRGLVATSSYMDPDLTFGRKTHYAVTVVASTGNPAAESPVSTPVSVTPQDAFPPSVPQRLEAFGISDAVSLRWDANQEPDLAGYFIYRSDDPSQPGSRLNAKPLSETAYIDRSVDRQKGYYYRVSAVDQLGNESAPTPPVAASASRP